ncbi:hypothetical protein FRC08_000812 [Ceratobasidium sp. 394]|nr:hypothetical protein FRC08_000812 [Ceratobasidium sp. 394]
MSSSSKPPNHGALSRSTTLKRKSHSLAEPNDIGSSVQHSVIGQSWYGQAGTATLHRAGSGQHKRESSGNVLSASRASSKPSKFRTTDPTYSRISATPLATIEPTQQCDMVGATFCDPKFVDNFLTVDSTRLQTVLDHCKGDLDHSHFQEHMTRERQLYDPICGVPSIIKQAVDGVPDFYNLFAFGDVSAQPIPSHHDDTAGIKPDLALFDGPIRHWETMRMPIEVKRQAMYLRTGMKQLTRCARAVFAHQLHRRHLYRLAICKTFIRFDQSGILYLKPVDMRSQEFREAFGYDTAFMTRARRNGRL